MTSRPTDRARRSRFLGSALGVLRRGGDDSPGARNERYGWRDTRRAGRSRPNIQARLVVLAVVAVVLAFLFVGPTQTWFRQRNDVQRIGAQVDALEQSDRDLQRSINRLRSPAEIERLARERFNMVKRGERAYRVVRVPGTAAASGSASAQPTTTTVAPKP